MTDVLFLVILAAFFALAVAFVHACERIIGPDLEADTDVDTGLDTDRDTDRATAESGQATV